MNDDRTEQFSWRLQGAVYGTAFFNGTVQSMGSTIVALLIVGLVNNQLGLLIGLIFAARQFLTVTMSIHGGALMDHFGTRRVIIGFGFMGVVAALAYPLVGPMFGMTLGAPASANPGWGFIAAIIAIQMISGWSEATSWIGSQTLVGQLMKGHPLYAGRMTFTARVGGFLGPPVIGMSWDGFGPWGGFGILALWIAGGMIAAAFLPETRGAAAPPETADETPPPPRTTSSDYAATLRLLLIPAIAMVIMITIMRQTGSGVQSSFYIVWLREEIGLSGTAIGWLIGAANAASALSSLGTGPLTRRISAHWLLIWMIGLSIVFISITPLLGNLYILLLFAICVRGLGQGLNLPLMMIIMSRHVGTALQGRVTALRISFNRFGGMVVPPIMGGLAEFGGLANAFYIIGAAGVIALCALSVWVSRSPAFREDS